MLGRGAVCVLTAAGSGSRLGAQEPKALVELAGHTLLAWAMRGLVLSNEIEAVVVTAPKEDVRRFQEELGQTEYPFPAHVVAGGDSRQGSVYRGLQALASFYDTAGGQLVAETPTLIHDAARPLTPSELIQDLVETVRGGRSAVIPGLPVVDTIKVVEENPGGPSLVLETPRRSALRSIQTPQAFHWKVIFESHARDSARGEAEEGAATDDAALLEASGIPVWLIPGDPKALKITTKADLLQAEQIARGLSF